MGRYLKLSNGAKVPALAWGNGSSGLSSSGVYAVDLGKAAFEAGIRHIDTAQSYETEEETAASLKASGLNREDVWITTKISPNKDLQNTADSIRENVTGSLKRLGFIPDLLLIHNPGVTDQDRLGEFWTHLEGLVEDGTLKGCSLGFSNFRPQDIEQVMKVAKIKPVAHQLEYHPYVLEHLKPVEALHAKHGILVEAYGPLTPVLRHPGGPLRPVLERIAEKQGLGSDIGRVLLKWVIQKGAVAVTTSTKPDTIKKLAEVDQLEDLSSDDMDAIEKAGRSVHFRYYDEHMSQDFPAPALPHGGAIRTHNRTL